MWTILGIAPTSDVKAIKRAYAVKLKTINPEDDPAAFQVLRGAYEQAIQAIENGWAADYLVEQEESEIANDSVTPVQLHEERSTDPLTVAQERLQANLWQEADKRAGALCDELLQTFTATKARELLNERLKDDWLIALDSKHFFERCLINKVAEKIDDFCDEPLEVLVREFGWVDHKHILWHEEYYAMHTVWQDYQSRKTAVQQSAKTKKTDSKTNSWLIWLLIFALLQVVRACSQSEPTQINEADRQAIELKLEQLKRDGTVHSIDQKPAAYWGNFDTPNPSLYNKGSIQQELNEYTKLKEAQTIVDEVSKKNAK